MKPVTFRQLQDLANLVPKPEPKPWANGQAFDLDGWIAGSGLAVASRAPWAGGRKWVLNPCPWNPEHTNRAAFIVQFGNGAIAAGCHHNGCQGRGWRELRDLVEPGWRERRQQRSQDNAGPTAAPAAEEPAAAGPAEPAGPPPWETPIPLAAIPPAPPFPLEVLPPPLQRFVREVAQAKHAPLDYAAAPLLAIAGGAIGASRALTIKPGWSERPCLWCAVVAPPGSAKTPAIKDAALPVYEEQGRLLGNWRRLREESPALKEPACCIGDITTEALVGVLQGNPRGVVMIRDELTAWAASMDQYKSGGRGADRQVWLQSWSGEPISVHRKLQEDGSQFVAHPFIGIAGGLPPSSLSRLCGGVQDDGFLDRILFAFPEPVPVAGEDWRCVTEEAARSWAETLRWLWDLAMQADGDRVRPYFLHLDSSGRTAWEQFTASLAAEMNREDFPEHLRGPWAKLRGYGARLALIVHCLRCAAGECAHDHVDGASVLRAAKLVGYFGAHARKVYQTFDAEPDIAECKRVLRWLARTGKSQFKTRDVLAGAPGRGLKHAGDWSRLAQRLIQHHYLRERRTDRRPGPGQPEGTVYEVNPEVLQHKTPSQHSQHSQQYSAGEAATEP